MFKHQRVSTLVLLLVIGPIAALEICHGQSNLPQADGPFSYDKQTPLEFREAGVETL